MQFEKTLHAWEWMILGWLNRTCNRVPTCSLPPLPNRERAETVCHNFGCVFCYFLLNLSSPRVLHMKSNLISQIHLFQLPGVQFQLPFCRSCAYIVTESQDGDSMLDQQLADPLMRQLGLANCAACSQKNNISPCVFFIEELVSRLANIQKVWMILRLINQNYPSVFWTPRRNSTACVQSQG